MKIKREYNPLVLDRDNLAMEVDDGLTTNQVIEQCDFVFTRPFVALVNGVPMERKEWNSVLPKRATVHFVELPRNSGGGSNPLNIIATIAVVALAAYTGGWIAGAPWGGAFWGSVASAAVMVVGGALVNSFFSPSAATAPSPSLAVSSPSLPTSSFSSSSSGTIAHIGGGDRGKPDTIYSLSIGGGNQIRLGQPFVEHFGRVICFPDLVQQNYTQIEDNDHYLYVLGIIGIGEYDIESVCINKTPIGDYEGTQYTILQPGQVSTLIPNVVWTCAELSNQELTTGWLTAVVSAAGTECDHVEFDIIFPGGLVAYNESAERLAASATVRAEVRKVDYYGNPTTAWILLHQQEFTATSKDPLRFSIKKPGPEGAGRYEIRIKRTSAVSDNSSTVDRVSLGGVRAYGGVHPDYGNVTMFECKIKATDQLNGNVAGRINVIATRKLPLVISGGFGATMASRSIIDAIAYIVTTENGGRQSEAMLDFSSLTILRGTLETMQYFFDWRFSQKITVMDAMTRVARCGRAMPYMPGGLLSVVQDEEKLLPSQVFTEDDYSHGSLKLAHGIRTVDSPTCVKMSYVNPETWQEESVVCLDMGGTEERPTEVALEGCTSRQHAYEIGMYLYRDDSLNRTGVEFITGLKGHLPQPGARLLISANMIDWGQTGKIADLNGLEIWLSEPVRFGEEADSGVLYLTGPDGAAIGPVGVSPSDHSHCVIGNLADVKTLKENGAEAASYLFGPLTQDLLSIRFLGAQPRGQNEIKIVGNIVHNEVYEAPGEAPPVGSIFIDGPPLASLEAGFIGKTGADLNFQTMWAGSAPSFRVEIDTGSGFAIVLDNHTGYVHTVTTTSISGQVRVTPYIGGTLQSGSAKTRSFSRLQAPTGLAVGVNDGETVAISWGNVSGATGYNVDIIAEGEIQTGRYETVNHSDILAQELAQVGGPWTTFNVSVYALRSGERSDATAIEVTIPPPPAPESFHLVSRLIDGVHLAWDAVNIATGYVVHRGDTAGFTPSQANAVYVGPNENAAIAANVWGDYTHYFKVAAYNEFYGADNLADLNYTTLLVETPALPAPIPLTTGTNSFPDDGATHDQGWVHLHWPLVQGATKYRVKSIASELADPRFSGTQIYEGIVNEHRVEGLSFQAPFAHYWAVAAMPFEGMSDSDLNWEVGFMTS